MSPLTIVRPRNDESVIQKSSLLDVAGSNDDLIDALIVMKEFEDGN